MKKMSTTAMRETNGGGLFLATGTCPYCKKKFTGLLIAYAIYAYHLKTCSKR